MTRRTDWAEYAYLDAARHEWDQADDGGSAETGGDGYHGGSAGTGDGAYGGNASQGVGRAHGRAAPDGTEGPYGSHGDEPGGGELPDGVGWPDSGAARGTGSPGGSRRGGSTGPRGAGGSRGRRRRGRGEPSGEDGGAFSSSRAEKGEPPGDPVEQARAICLRLLTGTPRTRKQLADALRKREIPDDAAEQVLSRFEEVGLIDDSAFADAWVESRHHGRGLARRALVQELRTKGVDSTLIDAAVSQLDSEQEEATARELVARKLRATRGLDRDKRLRRLAGMLARKGYPEGMALRVVRQALEEEGEDTEFLGDEGF
ncbi:recombination regulator RecX [Streptomyces sp. S.PNR 29]|uniref:recombination regulator RecX n=1 Tax=Streptomyces sp. S.PNR 29 TaxID=2973805 RepID=UPI0025B16A0D|nr:recombination regulator RecX [Streptomyces sp. S.PNR 29]MDN0197577.1 recombination regulator RecX [Streptomyces sp. S.PNR 29]